MSDRSGDATEQLRAAIVEFERDRLDGERLWNLVDAHRGSGATDTGTTEPGDHDLLDQLAETVHDRRATAASRP